MKQLYNQKHDLLYRSLCRNIEHLRIFCLRELGLFQLLSSFALKNMTAISSSVATLSVILPNFRANNTASICLHCWISNCNCIKVKMPHHSLILVDENVIHKSITRAIVRPRRG